MPQAPTHLQGKFEGTADAIAYLEEAGYTLLDDWSWRPPAGLKPCIEELDAIEYLMLEWDFGGLNEQVAS